MRRTRACLVLQPFVSRHSSLTRGNNIADIKGRDKTRKLEKMFNEALEGGIAHKVVWRDVLQEETARSQNALDMTDILSGWVLGERGGTPALRMDALCMLYAHICPGGHLTLEAQSLLNSESIIAGVKALRAAPGSKKAIAVLLSRIATHLEDCSEQDALKSRGQCMTLRLQALRINDVDDMTPLLRVQLAKTSLLCARYDEALTQLNMAEPYWTNKGQPPPLSWAANKASALLALQRPEECLAFIGSCPSDMQSALEVTKLKAEKLASTQVLLCTEEKVVTFKTLVVDFIPLLKDCASGGFVGMSMRASDLHAVLLCALEEMAGENDLSVVVLTDKDVATEFTESEDATFIHEALPHLRYCFSADACIKTDPDAVLLSSFAPRVSLAQTRGMHHATFETLQAMLLPRIVEQDQMEHATTLNTHKTEDLKSWHQMHTGGETLAGTYGDEGARTGPGFSPMEIVDIDKEVRASRRARKKQRIVDKMVVKEGMSAFLRGLRPRHVEDILEMKAA